MTTNDKPLAYLDAYEAVVLAKLADGQIILVSASLTQNGEGFLVYSGGALWDADGAAWVPWVFCSKAAKDGKPGKFELKFLPEGQDGE